MPDRRWKRAEREIAALLGGVRLPNSGKGQPDVILNVGAQGKKARRLLVCDLASLMTGSGADGKE